MSKEEETAQNTKAHDIKLMTDRNINETRMAAAGRLSFDLVALIENEIQTNQFQVNQVQKEFKLKTKENKDEAKRNSESVSKRYQLHEDVQKSTKEDDTHHLIQRKYFKSEMTQQDIEKIKKIKLLQKKYDMELDNKVKLYEESLKKFHQEERQLLQKQKKEKNQERLKEVAKKIQQIRNRQEERKKKMEEDKKRLTQIKNQKRLYERLDEQYRSHQLQEQKKKEEIKLAIKAQKNFHFDQIKEHEKKYDEIMRAQRQQRQKKLGQLARGSSKKYYQSRLLKELIEQEERAKIQHIEKKNELKKHALKKQEYAEYVRTHYKPNIPDKDEEEQQTKDKIHPAQVQPIARSASVHEIYKLGNDYMKQAHENIQNLKGSSVSKVEKKEQPFKYKDYLQDIKAERKLSSQKESRFLDQIDSLLKKQNLTQQEKFYKAKLITQKIEEKKGRDSQKLIESINAKIHILKNIQAQ